jgi:tyrosine--tRNA ligase
MWTYYKIIYLFDLGILFLERGVLMGVFEELQARGLIAQITNEEEIKNLVNTGKAIFYLGFDPTADSLHVGHFMALALMRRLQLAGNKPVVLVGGGTGYIGDPSGRTDMRTMMTPETIQHNCDCFKVQMSKFIDFSDDKAIMVNNADWLLQLNYIEMLREVGPHFSVNNMLRAECYKNRMEKGLSFLEFNYMVMQSYDFYHLFREYGCNIQLGGNDQWSNLLGGTELIRRKLGQDAHAMTIPLLTKADGTKMGKTAGGAVWLDPNKTSPFDFYQYWRNVDDADVINFIKKLTFLSLEEIKPMEAWEGAKLNEAKELLAFEMTKLVHSEEDAKKAQEASKALFAGGADDSNMPTTEIDPTKLTDGVINVTDLMLECDLVPSRSEVRRLVQQGGLTISDKKVDDLNLTISLDDLKEGVIIKKGKKKFHKALVK